MPLHTVTDASFDAEVVNTGKAVLAFFWAEWSGPSTLMRPTLEELSADYDGRLTVAELNIDQNPATGPLYEVSGIPTMLLFKNGTVAGTRVGPHSKSQMREFLDPLL